MKNLDYLFINGAVGTKTTTLFSQNEYQVLATSRTGFFKTLIDLGYKNLEYDKIDDVLVEGYEDLKEYLKTITQNNEDIIKFFYFRFDLTNILVLLKEKLTGKKGKLGKLGCFTPSDLSNILFLKDFTKLNDEKTFFETIINSYSSLSAFNLSNLVIKEGYKYLNDYIAVNDIALKTYFDIEVTIKNVMTLYRIKRLNASFEDYLDSIIPYGLVEHDVLVSLYDHSSDEIGTRLNNLFNVEFVGALEALGSSNDLEVFNYALNVMRKNLLRDLSFNREQLGSLVYYVFLKETEFKNIKSIYLDKENLNKIVL